MKLQKLPKALILCFILLCGIACENKDLFQGQQKGRLPQEDYFDFSTSTGVHLDINYGYTGYTVLFSLYLENPIDENGWKKDAKPFFSAYTDQNSSFEGNVQLPISAKTIYLCSDEIGIPSCLALDINNNSIQYKYSENSKIKTRTAESPSEACIDINNHTATIDASHKLYALYDDFHPYNSTWKKTRWQPWNTQVSKLYSILPPYLQLTQNSSLGQLLNRINENFVKTDNTNLIVPTEAVNLSIAHQTPEGNDVEKCHVDLVFLRASGGFHNAMGYYYYKTGTHLTAEEVKALPKFMVFPRTTRYYPEKVIKARLQFYGANYDTTVGSDDFPPGYSIGFVLVADMASQWITGTTLGWDNSLSSVNYNINAAINASSSHAIYSNSVANPSHRAGCIALLDKPSERIIIGFEDQTFNNTLGDKSMEDILFYVKANPFEAVIDIDDPKIPTLDDAGTNSNNVPEKLVTNTIEGTLAFEDIWPDGGDYDMNDVVVEYKTDYTYNKENKIIKIVDSFTLVHNGASLNSALGYIINNNIGYIDIDKSNFTSREENNQFILCPDCKSSIGKTYKVTRTFATSNAPLVNDFTRNYNPFIVPNYSSGQKNRKEVHLPKMSASPWANVQLSNTSDDAYFIDKSGKYPFAIDLLNIKDFEVASEALPIGSPTKYPEFNKWADSDGKQYTNWYLHKK
jgi:LruC domain-containing protein